MNHYATPTLLTCRRCQGHVHRGPPANYGLAGHWCQCDSPDLQEQRTYGDTRGTFAGFNQQFVQRDWQNEPV